MPDAALLKEYALHKKRIEDSELEPNRVLDSMKYLTNVGEFESDYAWELAVVREAVAILNTRSIDGAYFSVVSVLVLGPEHALARAEVKTRGNDSVYVDLADITRVYEDDPNELAKWIATEFNLTLME